MEGWLKCADGLQCIRERMMCNPNGKVHCNDGSDEDAVTCGREGLFFVSLAFFFCREKPRGLIF